MTHNKQVWQKTDDEMLRTYERLHEGLHDMIESGRLTEDDIPDDYDWLVQMLSVECQVEQERKPPPKKSRRRGHRS